GGLGAGGAALGGRVGAGGAGAGFGGGAGGAGSTRGRAGRGGGDGLGLAELVFGFFDVDVVEPRRIDFSSHDIVDDRGGREVEADGERAQQRDHEVDPEGDEGGGEPFAGFQVREVGGVGQRQPARLWPDVRPDGAGSVPGGGGRLSGDAQPPAHEKVRAG